MCVLDPIEEPASLGVIPGRCILPGAKSLSSQMGAVEGNIPEFAVAAVATWSHLRSMLVNW